MKNEFIVARFVIAVLEILGWLTVLVGVWIALAGGSILGTGGGLLSGFGVALVGVFQVASAQIIRASVVTAENSAAIRALVERYVQSQPSQPRLGGRFEVPGREPKPAGWIKNYKGKTIVRGLDGVRVEGEERVFANVLEAERFIDGRDRD